MKVSMLLSVVCHVSERNSLSLLITITVQDAPHTANTVNGILYGLGGVFPS